MTPINSIPSNIAEGSRLLHRKKLVPEPLLSKGVVLLKPIGKMLHGLVESLEARVSAQNE